MGEYDSDKPIDDSKEEYEQSDEYEKDQREIEIRGKRRREISNNSHIDNKEEKEENNGDGEELPRKKDKYERYICSASQGDYVCPHCGREIKISIEIVK